ncbi:MAG: FHA domain-containing protein [Hyphomicrobiaceae bacterium]|nr:FHA domain-containing protein [Hyphomicrobiaceae bacterium]
MATKTGGERLSRPAQENTVMGDDGKGDGKGQAGHRSGFLGSLKDALVAASRDDTAPANKAAAPAAEPAAAKPQASLPPPMPAAAEPPRKDASPAGLSAAEAAREVRAPAGTQADRHFEADQPPTTRVVRTPAAQSSRASERVAEAEPRTQLVRGRQQVKRGVFHCDPVVGWLVIVGGPGMGAFKPIFEGNNTIGRNAGQRIALDFGDDAISGDEQAYIRYDSSDRSFLFVPNLSKTNVVSLNDKRPTGAVELHAMDVITMGRTQLVFVPFCGSEFDWAELVETKD